MYGLQKSFVNNNSDLLQVLILHYGVKVDNVQLKIWASLNLILNIFYLKFNDFFNKPRMGLY